MDKFLIKLPKPKDGQPSSSSNQPFVSSQVAPEVQRHTNSFPLSNMDSMLDFKSLEADPKDRMPISSYSPNIRDAIKSVNFDQLGLREDLNGWNIALKQMRHFVCVVICSRMNLKVVEMPEIHLQEMVLGVGTKL
ncbi:hypothetical protein KY284_026130 [Solanum tuberosum]|nr:hypothetical protein KY284_026130 [Solanum tuberosum]